MANSLSEYPNNILPLKQKIRTLINDNQSSWKLRIRIHEWQLLFCLKKVTIDVYVFQNIDNFTSVQEVVHEKWNNLSNHRK